MNSLPIGNFYINLKAEGLDSEKITSHITDKLGYKYIEVANGRAFWVPENRNLYHNSKDYTKHFIKQPEYTLDNLPEKWFVEISDDIDRELLCEKLGREDKAFVFKCYTFEHGSYGYSNHAVDDCINVTHLFLKKKEEKEDKMQVKEIIEIDGKKYQIIDTQGNFENGDLVRYKDKTNVFIGYTKDNKAVLQSGINFAARELNSVCKLEQLTVFTWYYAIYKDECGLCHSDFYTSKEKLEKNHPNALEYRTFEEQL